MRPNLAVLRSAIEPMLTETGTVKRATGAIVFDEVTRYETQTFATVYTGPVLVQPEGDATLIHVGGTSWPVRPLDVTFPHDADIQIDDVLTLTECFGDPELVGQEIGIQDVRHDSWQAARYCKGQVAGTA